MTHIHPIRRVTAQVLTALRVNAETQFETLLVSVEAAGETGTAFTRVSPHALKTILNEHSHVLLGRDPFDLPTLNQVLRERLDALSWPVLSIIDLALWDLKAKLLGVPLVALTGRAREEVRACIEIRGTENRDHLHARVSAQVAAGFTEFRYAIHRNPGIALEEVRTIREAIGPRAGLQIVCKFIEDSKTALLFAERLHPFDVNALVDPLPDRGYEVLSLVRVRLPPGMRVIGGKALSDATDIRRLLQSQAVDWLELDPTRCGGLSGLLAAAALADAHGVGISVSSSPLHASQLGCVLPRVAQIHFDENELAAETTHFATLLTPRNGMVRAQTGQPGLGLSPKHRTLRAAG